MLRDRKQTALLSAGRERLFLIESARWKSTRDGSREYWSRNRQTVRKSNYPSSKGWSGSYKGVFGQSLIYNAQRVYSLYL